MPNKTREEINQYQRELYHKNREKILIKQREKYKQNREQRLEKNRKYYHENKEKFKQGRQRYYQAHKEEYKRSGLKFRRKLKAEIFSYYSKGVPKCRCCGEETIEFLSINHINKNGREHRRGLGGGGDTLYKWIKKNNFPSGFEVLCYNCNCSLGFFGYCPHDSKSNSKEGYRG